jgi:hypothetical protein
MNADKYPRTFHFPFSPGATDDDLIADSFDRVLTEPIVMTEKLDGENSCLNEFGVFSRSHATPCRDPWTNHLWDRWELLKDKLKGLEFFGENLYAVHSIEYSGLESHFYIFAIREEDRWYFWEEVEFYSQLVDIPTVPVLYKGSAAELKKSDEKHFEGDATPHDKLKDFILSLVAMPSQLCDPRIYNTPKEGLVVRTARSFTVSEFSENVFKWVRPHHVQNEEHWRNNWRRAKLHWELERMYNFNPI